MPLYYSFSNYLKDRFKDRVHRISLNAGFTCPNKEDGKESSDGCIFCNEQGFSQFATSGISLKEQIEYSMARLRKEKKVNKFIAYFQNATGTNADVDTLKETYDIIKEYRDIVALNISTRPDCVQDGKIELIASYTKDYEVWIEYGLQTIHDRTLDILNRGHSFKETVDAIERTAKHGIKVGVHVILGLPGETKEDMISTAKMISRLPVSGVKLHVLHVLKNTKLEQMYLAGEVKLLSEKEYVNIACDFLENLRTDCVIFRLVSDADKKYLVAPDWINNKLFVINRIEKELVSRGTRQGSAMGL